MNNLILTRDAASTWAAVVHGLRTLLELQKCLHWFLFHGILTKHLWGSLCKPSWSSQKKLPSESLSLEREWLTATANPWGCPQC